MLRLTLPVLFLSHYALSQSPTDSIADGPGGLTLNPAGEYDTTRIGNLASDNTQTYMNPSHDLQRRRSLDDNLQRLVLDDL